MVFFGVLVVMKIMLVELGNMDREKIKEKFLMLNFVEKIYFKYVISMFCVWYWIVNGRVIGRRMYLINVNYYVLRIRNGVVFD